MGVWAGSRRGEGRRGGEEDRGGGTYVGEKVHNHSY